MQGAGSLGEGDEEGGHVVSLEGGELGGRGESEAADQQVVHHVEVRPKLLEDGGVAGEEGQHRTAQVALQVPQHTLTLERGGRGGGRRGEGGEGVQYCPNTM